MLDKMRIIKSPSEIEKLEKATQISDEAFKELLGFIKPGMTEGEIRKKLLELFEKRGADEPAFDVIVAQKENASKPHYNGAKGVIRERDLVLVGLGAGMKAIVLIPPVRFSWVSRQKKKSFTA